MSRADFVFADDIRLEVSGKLIIIGVYTGDLSPTVFPASFPLSCWVRVYDMPIGSYPLTAKEYINGQQVHDVTLTAQVSNSSSALPLLLIGMPIQVDNPGKVTITIETPELGQIAEGEIAITRIEESQGS